MHSGNHPRATLPVMLHCKLQQVLMACAMLTGFGTASASWGHVLAAASPVEVVQHQGGDGTCGVGHEHGAIVSTHLPGVQTQRGAVTGSGFRCMAW